MAHRDIILASRNVRPHKCFIDPEFDRSTVLVSNHFDYVELWLKKKGQSEALSYWSQSKNFYYATESIPSESKPLTAYYCMLNATKALLTSKGIPFSSQHGCSGKTYGSRAVLINEACCVKGNGILPELAKYFGDNLCGKEISLKRLLFNIPFIHRAFTNTFTRSFNLFIPLTDPHFVYQRGGHEAWFTARISDKQYHNKKILDNQRGWEIDFGQKDDVWVRRTKRFKWIPKANKQDKIGRLLRYHKRIRRDVKYIYGNTALWYLKRNHKHEEVLNWGVPSLVYLAMHRLSELCRYEPQRLLRHFESQQNWLLTEFLNLAPINFVDLISCEITGRNIMPPGYRSMK